MLELFFISLSCSLPLSFFVKKVYRVQALQVDWKMNLTQGAPELSSKRGLVKAEELELSNMCVLRATETKSINTIHPDGDAHLPKLSRLVVSESVLRTSLFL